MTRTAQQIAQLAFRLNPDMYVVWVNDETGKLGSEELKGYTAFYRRDVMK